jgi:hypothetical protein
VHSRDIMSGCRHGACQEPQDQGTPRALRGIAPCLGENRQVPQGEGPLHVCCSECSLREPSFCHHGGGLLR